jgi:hypothetical protein
MNKTIEELGFNDRGSLRIMFRLNFIIRSIQESQKVLANGNLASWEPPMACINQSIEDLTDVVKELVTLLNITINQKEQGIASPPNEDEPHLIPQGDN